MSLEVSSTAPGTPVKYVSDERFPGVKIGKHCIIDDDVEIGEGTIIRNFVEIRGDVRIGRDCYIDSYVLFTGEAVIGDNVTLRPRVIIGRNAHVEDRCFFAPMSMMNNLNEDQEAKGCPYVGEGSFIGTGAVIHHGVRVGAGTIVGTNAFLNRDTHGGRWVGVPAECLDPDPEQLLESL